ncbi:unnamed protein product [Ceratitis capitata]|uniref:(Mediterranean fruit fly) hypothetical protein n=1 Tax=Ceratitis capitata TaxID=7213 RepID=A0A811VJY3_CERCA|nr:unnamed protein product [Ceratitis capitata]
MLELLDNVRGERGCDTIAFCLSTAQECIFEQLLPEISTPVLLIHRRLEYDFKASYSRELIILLCLADEGVATAFESFHVFRGLKQTRIIAYAPQASDLELIEKYCAAAMTADIYNVLIIQEDFSATHNYYTCNRFPLDAPPYKQKSLTDVSSAIFEHQFRDMHGMKMRTYPDQLQPRTMLYFKPDGKLVLEGYIGRLLRTFAEKRNAALTIEHPYKVGKTTYYGDLLALALNNTVDVAAGLAFPTSLKDFEVMSYPVQTLDYCFMVPLPEAVPINELFVGIIRLPTLFWIFVFIVIFAALLTHLNKGKRLTFINLFLNDKSIRGMLGQSFVAPMNPSLKVKFIIFLLCYMSTITNTTYQSYLQSFLTHPPLQPMYRSYEDMAAAGLKISFPINEQHMLTTNKSVAQHKELFLIAKDYDAWLRDRSAMSVKFVYPVSNVRWEVFDFQQSLFSRPIFYFNTDLCFFKNSFVCLPTRPDLPYGDLLDDYILRLHSSGIMNEWISLNFYILAKLKMVFFEDLSTPWQSGRPLDLNDFFWIRMQFFGSLALGFLAAAVTEGVADHGLES